MAEIKPDQELFDETTGEKIIRIKVNPEFLADLEKHANAAEKHANIFLQLSAQIVNLQIQQRSHFDLKNKADQDIGKEVIRIREKMKLDSSWVYNIPSKMLEKREAPPETRVL